ncbi:hypothetical protein D3C87_993140 [compost metagenome]
MREARFQGLRLRAPPRQRLCLLLGQCRQALTQVGVLLLTRLQQSRERAAQVRRDARHVDALLSQQHQAKARRLVIDRQAQRVVGAFAATQGAHALQQRGRGRLAAITVVQQRREQRRAAGHPTAAQGKLQAGVLVVEQALQRVMHLLQARRHTAAAQPDANRQGIDEHADRAVHIRPTAHAAEQQRPEHDVILAGGARQHQRPSQVEHRRRTDAMAARQCADGLCLAGIQALDILLRAAAIGLHIQPAERRGGFIHVRQHGREELPMCIRRNTQPRLRDEISERHRIRQGVSMAGQDQCNLGADQLQRGVVHDQVMARQLQQPPVPERIVQRHCSDHGRVPRIDAIRRLMDQRIQIGLGVGAGRRGRRLFQLHPRLAQHHLQRLGHVLPDDGRTQQIVAGHHLLQGRHEPLQPRLGVEGDQIRQQVGIRPVLQEMVKQNPLLQRRKRIDVLDVRRAAGHGGLDGAQMRIRQRGQRHHVWRQRPAIRGDPIGRDGQRGFDVALLPRDLTGEVAQPRMFEDGPRRHGPFLAPQLLHQLDRHQRVAAQFEEMVLAPDTRHMQHFGPDPRNDLFHCAGGGLVGGLRLRGIHAGQLAPVDLAIGIQRQRRQEHPERRHHELRQPALQIIPQRLAQFSLRQLVGGHPRGARHHIRHQPPLALPILVHRHHRRGHRLVPRQLRLDLAQLQALPADLDLLIRTSQVFQHPIAPPPRQVARAVQPPSRLRRQRIRHEALGRQPRPRQIPSAHAHARHVQLANHPHRQRLQAVVQHIQPRIVRRTAYRQQMPVQRLRPVHPVQRHVVGALGRAIGIDQRHPRIARKPRPRQLRRRRLPRGQQPTQPRQRHRIARQHRLYHRRHALQHRHALLAHGRQQRARIPRHLVRHDLHARPAQQPRQHLPHRHVETHRRRLRNHVIRTQPKIRNLAQLVVQHALLRHHHALRLSCRP